MTAKFTTDGAANMPRYTPQRLKSFRFELQQPRTRKRESIQLLAVDETAALEQAWLIKPGFWVCGIGGRDEPICA